ncbi:MAG TPA: diaminopimelate epimerase, partial [Thermoflexales bacterium]|nr:diaminopimelate epimerase [Thermoflexales bacterium]
MRFHKYQALGNDYLVLETAGGRALIPSLVRRICNRHFGLGSDGILLEAPPGPGARFGLRILNPDGSEAEKSGNGLRIFARYLWDEGRVNAAPFSVSTRGGDVTCQIREGGQQVFVEMGSASFDSARIPVAGQRREVVGDSLPIGNESLRFTAVTVGNPHCVVHVDEVSPELAQ